MGRHAPDPSPGGAKDMAHTCSNVLVHLIFSTKQRLPSIKPEMKTELFAYLGGIVRQIHGVALIINGTVDHVHILMRVPADHSTADMARVIKTNSSKWVHEKWPDQRNFGWQTGYGAFSVSTSNVEAVSKYIADQENHHAHRSFQEEFVIFLKKNGIPYDERYIWS
jgi:REP element-mobilizing transposase RayT